MLILNQTPLQNKAAPQAQTIQQKRIVEGLALMAILLLPAIILKPTSAVPAEIMDPGIVFEWALLSPTLYWSAWLLAMMGLGLLLSVLSKKQFGWKVELIIGIAILAISGLFMATTTDFADAVVAQISNSQFSNLFNSLLGGLLGGGAGDTNGHASAAVSQLQANIRAGKTLINYASIAPWVSIFAGVRLFERGVKSLIVNALAAWRGDVTN